MSKEDRLHKKISHLEQSWDTLSEKLHGLKTQKIHENRIEERQRLESLIEETCNELREVEQELGELEAEIQTLPVRTIDQNYDQLLQDDFAQCVRKEIGKLLANQKLRPLTQAILDLAKENKREISQQVRPEELLIPQEEFSIQSAIDDLHKAAQVCLEDIIDRGSITVTAFVDGVTSILGWLILLAVSEDWLGDHLELQDRLLKTQFIEIPVETEAGTEVVVSRLRSHQARFKLGDDKVGVSAIHRARVGQLELGITLKDNLKEIKKLIWKTVFKSDPPQNFDSGDEKKLQATLKTRYRRGVTYYVMIPESLNVTIAGNKEILKRLRADLEHLVVCMAGANRNEQILIINEEECEALIRELLLMLDEYI